MLRSAVFVGSSFICGSVLAFDAVNQTNRKPTSMQTNTVGVISLICMEVIMFFFLVKKSTLVKDGPNQMCQTNTHLCCCCMEGTTMLLSSQDGKCDAVHSSQDGNTDNVRSSQDGNINTAHS